MLPVILFHAGLPAFGGGWLGVDIFFVISGYLITGILARDLAAGRFSVARFYERRARRILPALTLVLLACLPAGLVLMSPPQLYALAQGMVAAALSVSNILYWRQLDYFGPDAGLLPLLHTWSLGIEEQFYLIFPLALAALWRRPAAIRPALVLALAASFGLAAWTEGRDPAAAFFLLPTRAWELLLGALVALVPVRARGPLALGGLALIAAAMAAVPVGLVPLAAIAAASAGAALVLGCTPRGSIAYRLLASPVPVGIGLVSYSAYLWHQPLLAFARLRFGPLDPDAALGLGLLALALAWPSWALVERPFRRASGGPGRPLVAAAATIGLLVAIGTVGLASDGLAARKPPAVRAILASVRDTNPHRAACKTGVAEANPVHPRPGCAIAGSLPGVIFYGDSHADSLQGGLWPAAEAAGFRFYSVTRSACPPIPGLTRTGAAASPACDGFVRGVETFAQAAGYPVAVLAARWSAGARPAGFDNGEGGAEPPPGDFLTPLDPRSGGLDREAAVIARYVAGIEALLASGARVVLVYPIPEVGWNVPEELARRREAAPGPVTLSTDYRAYLARQAPVLAAFDAIDSPNLHRVRPQDRLCDADLPGRCIANLGDRPLYFDDNHLNNLGAALIAPMIIEAVEAARRSLPMREALRRD